MNTRVAAIVLVVVVVAAGLTTWLLARVMTAAQSINDKAASISQNGRGINASTDSVIQLRRTNRTAASILTTAAPLDVKLSRVIALARDINGTAGSINSTAGAINSTAGTINSTAGTINSTAGTITSTAGTITSTAGRINSTAGSIHGSARQIDSTASTIDGTAAGINTAAAGILVVAKRIDRDVALINHNLDSTIALARAVKGDTGDIVGQARAAHHYAACIDQKVGGQSGVDRHCEEIRP